MSDDGKTRWEEKVLLARELHDDTDVATPSWVPPILYAADQIAGLERRLEGRTAVTDEQCERVAKLFIAEAWLKYLGAEDKRKVVDRIRAALEGNDE